MQQTRNTHHNALLSETEPRPLRCEGVTTTVDMESASCERKVVAKRHQQQEVQEKTEEPPTKRAKRVKQVHFAELPERPLKCPTDWTLEEKQARWILPAEKLCMRQSMVAKAQELIALDNQAIECGQQAFCEAYARIYGVCLRDAANASVKEPTFDFEDLSVFAYSEARGLEDCVVPSVGFERRHVRSNSQQVVFLAQLHHNKDPEQIRQAYEKYTATSRLLGETVAAADVAAAMMVHRS